MAFIGFGVWFYTRASSYHRNEFSAELALAIGGGEAVLHTSDLLAWLALGYGLVLLPYYALLPRVVGKARIALAYVLGQFFGTPRPSFGRDEQQALLALLLKFFFVPLMVNWLLGGISEVAGHWRALAVPTSTGAFLTAFNGHLYLLAFKSLLMVDVFLFTVGYVIEMPVLRNEIRSTDPTVAGWLVCLACYPPFNQAVVAFFSWQATDFPKFYSPALHVTLNCLILGLMAIYAWASLALGFRASNLTNRGIVSGGPYAWVRHPAYTAKNFVWWIGALPAIGGAFVQSFASGLWALCCVAAWTSIYVLRAITEERHLLMLDNGYSKYMQNVAYRFVPKLC